MKKEAETIMANHPQESICNLTQDDVDALWLACRIDLSALPSMHKSLQAKAQLRLQRLVSAGVVKHELGSDPVLA